MTTQTDDMTDYETLVLGGGAAGLSASIFTARFGLETGVLACGRSAIARCAHLENYLGFPGGIDPKKFIELGEVQARDEGVTIHGEMVSSLRRSNGRFVAETTDENEFTAPRVVAATVIDGDYIDDLDPELYDEDDRCVQTDPDGRTDVQGLYAAGRLADSTHQAVICAGDGADTAQTLITDVLCERGYWREMADKYTDWVTRDRRVDDRDEDWESRIGSWVRETIPEDASIPQERIEAVQKDVMGRFRSRSISEEERRERAERGQRLLTEHYTHEATENNEPVSAPRQ